MPETEEVMIQLSPIDWVDGTVPPAVPPGISITGPITVRKLAVNAADMLSFVLQVSRDVTLGVLAGYIYDRFRNRGSKRMIIEYEASYQGLEIDRDKITTFLIKAKASSREVSDSEKKSSGE